MAIDDIAVSGVKTVLDGQGSVTTVLALVTLALGYLCYKLYNKVLEMVERLIALTVKSNEVTAAFTEKLNDIIRNKN